MSNINREMPKVAVLYDVWEDAETTPPAPEEAPAPKGKARKPRRKKKREKPDREEVFEALDKLGHQPSYVQLDGRSQSLAAVARCDADLIFNLTESYAGDDTKDMNIAAYLDLLDRAYTGAGPHALYLAQDKALAKKIFAFHDIRTPYFATSYKGKLDHSHDISFPLIVKPTSEDGSIGIDASSVVGSVKELMEKIHYIHEEFDGPALIEEYIEGREIYAGVLGNDSPEALPLVELDLSKLPADTPRIAGWEVKFDKDSEAYKVTKSALAEDLDEDVVEQLKDAAKTTYRALKLRDYARIDMRLAKDGTIYVIEANPNPWLASSAEFSMAARGSGRTYTELIKEIVELAAARYEER
ncbi:MAG: ATP-grasp domain-containing protein [Acidobacteriota bacterium]|nr:ATP-grasp domain-containing protein [Acidobacteriota bacterium]